MIKSKLMSARRERNKTQKEMAELLCISQSQYQRREHGEIRIFDDEWERMANFLNKKVEDIKEDDTCANIYNCGHPSGAYSSSNNYVYSIFESMMKNQQEYIEMLKERIKFLEAENERLML
jgi:transcriptional regulator with XRE-family HTH domain